MSSTLLSLAQGEPGGGGNPGGGSQFTVSVVPVSGTDEFTVIMPGPAPGGTHTKHWVRSWVTGTWSINGTPTMMAPTIPVSHGISTTAPIEMTSQGTQKVVVQYTGQLPTNITEVGVILESTASAYYDNSGNAVADNGIGDESFAVAPGSDYSLVWLGGEYCTGRHLRVVKLNSAGYGELEFSSSANANSSGYGAKVWAEAQAAGAVKDPRSISLAASIANSPKYKVGATSHRFIDLTIAGITKTFYVSEQSREAISPKFPSTYTTLFEFPYGLARSEHDVNSSVPMENEWVRDLTGHSSWTEESILQYRSLGKISHFSWNISHPSFLTGSIMHPNSGNVHEYGIYTSETRTNTHEIEMPYRIVRYGLGWPFNTPDEQIAFIPGSLGETQTLRYIVKWADGVSGEATITPTFHDLREEVGRTSPDDFFDTNTFPWVTLDPTGLITTSADGFVLAGSDSCQYYAIPTPEWLMDEDVVELITDFASSISAPGVGEAASWIAASLKYYHNTQATALPKFMVSRPAWNNTNIKTFGGGSSLHYKDHPNEYAWKPTMQQPIKALITVLHAYNSEGYSGTLFDPVQKAKPKNMCERFFILRLEEWSP
ncbi:MAG: hypothetical protein ACKVQS_02205 [Fimbriimonadaceae bacterium]